MMLRCAGTIIATAMVIATWPAVSQEQQIPASEQSATPPVPEVIAGPAIAWDGDTIEIGGQVIRLQGIDSPEMRGDPRGIRARAALDDILAADPQTSCEVLTRDRYERPVARCRSGGRDLGDAMVRGGWAFSYRKYSTEYDAAEAEARAEGRGFWTETIPRSPQSVSLLWTDSLATLLASVAALLAAGIAVFLYYRRRVHEQCDLAAALMGEVSSIILVMRLLDNVGSLRQLIEHVRRGGSLTAAKTTQSRETYEIYRQNVPRLGLLPGSLPDRVAFFYSMTSILDDYLIEMRAGEYADHGDDFQLHLLDDLIDLVERILIFGGNLAEDLAKAAGRPVPAFDLPEAEDTSQKSNPIPAANPGT